MPSQSAVIQDRIVSSDCGKKTNKQTKIYVKKIVNSLIFRATCAATK